MSDRWWEKRRKERHPWFDVFHEFYRIEKIMDEMMRQAFSSSRSPFETSKKRKSFRPHVYGFSISVGPNGRPRIRKFGDLQRSRYGTRIMEQREPLVDVLDEEEEVVAVAELPGVQKEDINLHATEDELIINVDTPKRRYHKELPLPEEVDSKPVKTSYNNGVLEVRFKKKRRKDPHSVAEPCHTGHHKIEIAQPIALLIDERNDSETRIKFSTHDSLKIQEHLSSC